MVAAETRQVMVPARRVAHPEEWLSIIAAIVAAIGTSAYLWTEPRIEPASGLAWALPGWIAFGYLFVQLLFLLVSATQIRALGVLDSIVSILPFVAGLVLLAEWFLGRLPFSLFQLNALAIFLASGLGEFLLTVWIRFVLNRRTIAIDSM